MKRIEQRLPTARKEKLVVRELPDEVLVYDLDRHEAHCLNHTAALVWKHCDGRKTVGDMARLLEKEFTVPVAEEVVWLALEQLEKLHLLREQVVWPAGEARVSRRELVRKYLPAALALPVIMSITAPTAQAQASGCAGQQCFANFPFDCCQTHPICRRSSCNSS